MLRQGVGVNAIGDAGPAVRELLVGEDVALLARRDVRRAYAVVLASAMMSSTMSSMGRGPRAVRGAEVRRRSLPLQACRYITRRSCQDRGGPWLTAALELVTRLCAYIPTARPHGPPRGAGRPKAAMTQPCSSGLGQFPKQNTRVIVHLQWAGSLAVDSNQSQSSKELTNQGWFFFHWRSVVK